MNFYGNRTSGKFGVAATLKADLLATPKESLCANALFNKFMDVKYLIRNC
jgi:hypothetical protein